MGASEKEIMARMRALREPAPDAPPAQAPAEAPEPTPAAQAPDEPAQSMPEPEHAQEAPNAEPVALASETQEASQSEETEGELPTIETADELAEYLGVPVADLYNVRYATTDADGNRAEVTMGERKDAIVAEEVSRKKAQELERATAQLREEQQRYQQEAQTRLLNLQATMQAVERQALAGLDDATLDRAKADGDPDYGTMLAERMRRDQQLQEARNQVAMQVQQLREEQEAQGRQHTEQMLVTERAALLAQPEFREWRDPDTFSAGSARLTQYAQSVGFSESDVGSIIDSRVLTMLEKARLYDESQKAGAVAKKQVIKIGKKVAKPGAAQSKARTRGTELDSARKALRKSGHINDAVGLLRAKRQAT